MSSVFSDQWHLVSGLKPKLRQNAVLHRHLYRNEVWYLLRDETTGQFHRFSEHTYQIIGLLDGRFTLNQIWEVACEKLGDDMPTQDEMIELLQKLYQANALSSDIAVDIERFIKRQETQGNQKALKKWATPFGIKFPLFQPQKTLDQYDFVGKLFFNNKFLVLMLIFWMIGIDLTVTHWQALTNNLTDRLLAPDGLLLMAVIYPIIKIVHEFAHAFAVTKYGGKVHEMGVMLLVFFPVPYVDATAANGFSSKYRRMLVAASGILAELTIASLALVVWSLAEDGVLKALAFYVAITAGVSSLFFNGNPLLRFDAYYVLADALELPNLGTRANQHLGYLFKKFLLRLPNQLSVTDKLDEAWIFTLYGIAAFIYRIVVFIGIGLFVAQSYWFLGVVMVIWAGSVTLLLPAYKSWQKLLLTKEVKQSPGRFWFHFLSVLVFCVGLLGWVPLPYVSNLQGTIPANQSYALKAAGEGELVSLKVQNGGWVDKGQVLAVLDDEKLTIEIDKLKAQLLEVKAKEMAAINDVMKLKWLMEEQNLLRANLDEKFKQLAEKTIIATQTGIWINPKIKQGTFIKRGSILGYINPKSANEIFALVPEQDIALINPQAKVSIRFASQPLVSYPSRLVSISPSASNELISPILAKNGGGTIVLDETQQNKNQQNKTLGNYIKVVFELKDNQVVTNLEERLYIVIQHPAEPVIYRLVRFIRQNFLESFGI